MNLYEELLQEAADHGVQVYEIALEAFDGLYYNGRIFIDRNLETTAAKACVLAEEIGHYYTVVGNILDQSRASNRQQELDGRRYAYKRLLSFDRLIEIYYQCADPYEIPEMLGVTLEFFRETMNYYESAYGSSITYKGFIICFNPFRIQNNIIAI